MKKASENKTRKKLTTVKGKIKQRRRFKVKDFLRITVITLKVSLLVAICLIISAGFYRLWNVFIKIEEFQVKSIDVQGTERIKPEIDYFPPP